MVSRGHRACHTILTCALGPSIAQHQPALKDAPHIGDIYPALRATSPRSATSGTSGRSSAICCLTFRSAGPRCALLQFAVPPAAPGEMNCKSFKNTDHSLRLPPMTLAQGPGCMYTTLTTLTPLPVISDYNQNSSIALPRLHTSSAWKNTSDLEFSYNPAPFAF
ncbi:hypothetical protein FA95DRAFT_560456 [Auriscalpium vulgare]|uniref:Uncharacterized protein n=1 Tax=Auriscalpium vulgare TaxID=40419 RepID=A0ACB8REV3_9AGAM|nr:hypothetical protein FA95DRAFT_560456 [Auriscalpium vulgare]